MVEIIQNKNNFEKIEFFAQNGDEKLGRIAGRLQLDDIFVIDELECEATFADGLVRAILNLLDLHGIEKARFELSEDKLLILRDIGFFKDKPEIADIPEFFADKNCTKATRE